MLTTEDFIGGYHGGASLTHYIVKHYSAGWGDLVDELEGCDDLTRFWDEFQYCMDHETFVKDNAESCLVVLSKLEVREDQPLLCLYDHPLTAALGWLVLEDFIDCLYETVGKQQQLKP